MDLSVLIPARNEEFLARTIADVLKHSRAQTEVIAVLDGVWANPQIPDDPRVRLTHSANVIGQRAATNLAARMSQARYVMKLDAHCSVDEGFDVKLIEAGDQLGRDVTQIPAQFNLHIFNHKCLGCGTETYQGPTPTACNTCGAKGTPGGPFERVMYWDLNAGGIPGRPLRTEYWRFDETLHFDYWNAFKERPESKGDIVDVMTSLGACFFMRRDRFREIGGLDESAGSWGQYGVEVALKSWLSGGRHVVNKKTWFSHAFRTKGGDWGFPYSNPNSAVAKTRAYSQDMWCNNKWPKQVKPLSWVLDKFWPVPGWSDEARTAITTAGVEFAKRRAPRSTLREAVGVLAGVPVASRDVAGVLHDGQTDKAASRSPSEFLRQEVASGAVSLTGVDGVAPVVAAQGIFGVGHEFQVGRITAGRPIAGEVVENRDVASASAGWQRMDEPREHEPMAEGHASAETHVAVTASVSGASPKPATGSRINADLREDPSQRFGVEMGRGCEKLTVSHDVTSFTGDDVVRAGSVVAHQSGPSIVSRQPSKGICFYTENRCPPEIFSVVTRLLLSVGLPIVSVSLAPIDFGDNIVLPLERGYLSMFKQILAGLEALDTESAFLVEHDVLYHPSHFEFTPPRDDTFYYNQHVWKVDAESGRALHYLCSQTSGCCANRQLLVEHYRKRIAAVEANAARMREAGLDVRNQGYDRNLGFEPGTNARSRELDPHGAETWMSAVPNIDIRHGKNLTPSRWTQEEFRNKNSCLGWTEADAVPGWGVTAGRFRAFLADVSAGQPLC